MMLWETSLLEENKGGGSPWARGLHRQTRAAFGSATGQYFPAVLRAHAFAETVFSLLFEVRRLLKRKRHTGHPFKRKFLSRIAIERRIIGAAP